MFGDDRSYFQHRAEIEIERAQQATMLRVAQVHYEMAEAYLDRVASAERAGGNRDGAAAS